MFIESPTFPDDVSAWARGGASFLTDIVETDSGRRQRTIVWSNPLGRWELSEAFRVREGGPSAYSIKVVRDLFNVARGQAYGFRMKDWLDFKDDGNGVFQTIGPGQYQMYKNYIVGSYSSTRIIQKPRTATVYQSSTPMVSPPLDMTTGILTQSATNTYTVGTITPGYPTVIATTTLPSALAVGNTVYISGVTGTMSSINGVGLVITSISGSNVSVAFDSTGLVYASGGTLSLYPQASIYTWTGQFDVPVTFGFDNPTVGTDSTGALISWQSLVLVGVRP